MNLTPPRFWHQGRTILLIAWLFGTASMAALFFGAGYEGEGFSPRHLLIALLVTQAWLLIAALVSLRDRGLSLVAAALANPRLALRVSLYGQAALLIGLAAFMAPWNDELNNLQQARFMAEHGLSAWIDNYARLNEWLGPHHPPLLALMYGGFYALAGANVFAGRLLNIAFAIGALAVGTRLVRRLTDAPTAALASLCWALWPLWLFNGAAAILEAPFLFFALITVDAFAAFLQNPSGRRAAAVGGWLTFTLLGRYNMLLLLPGMALVLLARPYRRLLGQTSTYWMAIIPVVVLGPLLVMAATTDLLRTQASYLSWLFLLVRPGGAHYLVEYLLPLWPLHVGAHLLPILMLSLVPLLTGEDGERFLLWIGGCYLALVIVILPNPRYLLPAVPFLSVGTAHLLRALDRRGQGAATVWLGIFGATLVLAFLVIAGARIGDFYPFY